MARRGPILVIDDDPDLCALLQRALEHDGHEVVTAKNGMEAIRAYELNKPALLFVDLMMPTLDGEEFLRMLGTPRPPVVLITASVRIHEVAERFGVEAALDKPFEVSAVRELADRHTSAPSAEA